jgi:hypothetical protein
MILCSLGRRAFVPKKIQLNLSAETEANAIENKIVK